MFSKNPNKSYSIQKSRSYNQTQYIQNLTEELNHINRQIEITNKAIIDAQAVKVRSFFSSNNNVFLALQKRMIESNIKKSMEWHFIKLKDLRNERRQLQRAIDACTGKVWSRRIENFSNLLLLISISLIATAILIMAIIASLSIIPILIITMIAIVSFQSFRKS